MIASEVSSTARPRNSASTVLPVDNAGLKAITSTPLPPPPPPSSSPYLQRIAAGMILVVVVTLILPEQECREWSGSRYICGAVAAFCAGWGGKQTAKVVNYGLDTGFFNFLGRRLRN